MARKPTMGRGRKAIAERKPVRRKPVKQKPVKQSLPAFAMSVSEWCERHAIGRTVFYRMLREGKAPPTITMGRRRIITHEGSAQWLRDREREAMEVAAQRRETAEAAA
jgi:predicted DNA-binding transcriptional regulator AlpA